MAQQATLSGHLRPAGCAEEGEELGDVDGVGAIVIFGAAGVIADAGRAGLFVWRGGWDGQAVFARHVAHDEGLEAFFGGVVDMLNCFASFG